MHGRNDPIDPAGNARRPEPPTDEPAWLTDRPAPRSSYLFGDEPVGPSDGWYQDQPTEQWRPGTPHPYHAAEAYPPAEPSYPAEQGRHDAPTTSPASFREEAGWHSGEHYRAIEPGTGHYEPTGGWSVDEPTTPVGPATDWTAQHSTDRTARHAVPEPDRYDTVNQWYGTPGDVRPDGCAQPNHDRYGGDGADEPAVEATRASRATGRRRSRRPLVLGGAAAAATLAVSVGVAALAMPGDDTRPDATAGEGIVATAPALAEDEQNLPVETLDEPSPSPSVSPSTAAPSPSRTSRPTPAPSRSTAASRQGVERQGSPSRGATATTAPSSAAPTTGSPPAGSSSEAAQVVELANAERAKAGCGALSVDEKLMTAAQRHSQDQADNRNMSHTGSDGSDPGERIDRVGYVWRTYGENVAWNQKTPAAVMDAWMNSPGHRANILNCAFTEIGVGVASSNGPYWTQVFAAPR
ncbi:hypothetical protein C1I95_10710 [Micromonospora craterilacus]|uniref:SCP domain-containing protein n=1 Tax=Micromonospora craterilacus TaxID=1655439 RepID=A0A2W2F4C2_9ACTN|nr:CAP domain-containing protein [Micromonospora craterilacus]PZG19858.1 hypothetical protein C1I95_10710 [Micromonospora craterilacus]